MTQKEFDELPGLLTRAQFLAATGLTRHKLHEGVTGGQIRRYKLTKTGYGKYYKAEAARIGGFELK